MQLPRLHGSTRVTHVAPRSGKGSTMVRGVYVELTTNPDGSSVLASRTWRLYSPAVATMYVALYTPVAAVAANDAVAASVAPAMPGTPRCTAPSRSPSDVAAAALPNASRSSTPHTCGVRGCAYTQPMPLRNEADAAAVPGSTTKRGADMPPGAVATRELAMVSSSSYVPACVRDQPGTTTCAVQPASSLMDTPAVVTFTGAVAPVARFTTVPRTYAGSPTATAAASAAAALEHACPNLSRRCSVMVRLVPAVVEASRSAASSHDAKPCGGPPVSTIEKAPSTPGTPAPPGSPVGPRFRNGSPYPSDRSSWQPVAGSGSAAHAAWNAKPTRRWYRALAVKTLLLPKAHARTR